jgi:hypothetical protein
VRRGPEPVAALRRWPSGDTLPPNQPVPGSSASLRRAAGASGSTSHSVVAGVLRVPPCAVRSSGTELSTARPLPCSQPWKSWRSSGSVSKVTARVSRSSRYSCVASLPPLLRWKTM